MYHSIQFTVEFVTDLEVSRKQHLERLLIRQGDRFTVQIRPHVLVEDGDPVEVADLYFEDGAIARDVPFACFGFVEEDD